MRLHNHDSPAFRVPCAHADARQCTYVKGIDTCIVTHCQSLPDRSLPIQAHRPVLTLSPQSCLSNLKFIYRMHRRSSIIVFLTKTRRWDTQEYMKMPDKSTYCILLLLLVILGVLLFLLLVRVLQQWHIRSRGKLPLDRWTTSACPLGLVPHHEVCCFHSTLIRRDEPIVTSTMIVRLYVLQDLTLMVNTRGMSSVAPQVINSDSYYGILLQSCSKLSNVIHTFGSSAIVK